MTTGTLEAKKVRVLNKENLKELVRRYVENALKSAKGKVRTVRVRHLSFLGINPRLISEALMALCQEWPCGCEVLKSNSIKFVFKKC